MKSELGKLIELQIKDTNIRRLKKSIESADQRRADLGQEFEKQAGEIRVIQNQSETAKKEKLELEKQIEVNKTHLERADRNLKNSQNQKEYEAAMREADILQKEIARLENEVIEKIGAIEEVEKVLAERAEEIAGLESKQAEAFAALESELKANVAEFDRETKSREEVFKTLPANLASIYNRMAQRSRDGIAVAEVKNGSCSACFMSLRPQRQLEIKRGDQIITCESCARILYIITEESQSEAMA